MVKVSSISSEVGLATRTTEKPAPNREKPAPNSAESASVASAKRSQKVEWPETIGINFEVSEKTLQQLKPLINGFGLGLEFSQDPQTGQRIITVYDLKTGAVIRQIPPKEILAILRRVQHNQALSAGLFVSRRL
jgi:flagellar protein FlaG